jgi:putative MATE family efflux protein
MFNKKKSPDDKNSSKTVLQNNSNSSNDTVSNHRPVGKNHELLEGEILPSLLKLVYPILISMFAMTVFNIVDTFYVARLGTQAIAAMGFTFPIYMFLIAIGAGLTIGVSSAVARSLGAGDTEFAAETGKQGLVFALALGLSFTLGGTLLAPSIISFMGARGVIQQMANDYVLVIVLAGAAKYLLDVFDGTLRGEGLTKASMRMLLVASISNIILDPFFIFGLWFFPRLEVKGAAIATALSWVIGCLYAFDYYRRGNGIFRLDFRGYFPRWQHLREILSVGLPASFNQGFLSLSLFFFNYILMLLPQGDNLVATFGIGFRVEALMVLPLVGLAAGSVIMVGQNYGAKKLKRVEEIFLQGQKFIFLIMGLVGILVIILAPYMIIVFTSDSEVLRYGSQYFRLTALTYCFLGVGMLANAIFQGMGSGFPPFFNIMLRLLVFQVSGAFILAIFFQLGHWGAWGAVALANVGYGAISSFWVRSHLRRKLKVAVTEPVAEPSL